MDPTRDRVVALTLQVWECLIDRPIECDGAIPGFAAVPMTGWVQISGRWNGSVVVQCPALLAQSVTDAVLDTAPGGSTADDVADALGEIANMIGGNVKSLVDGPSQLSLPVVKISGESLTLPPNETCVLAAFRTEDQPVLVSVLRHLEQTTTGAPA